MAEQKTTTTAKKGRPATKTKAETKPKTEVMEMIMKVKLQDWKNVSRG